MTHISNAYAAKLAIAEALSKQGARAVTMASIAGIKSSDARKLFKQINNCSSTTGQTPTDHQWFLSSEELRRHGALLLQMYAKYRHALADSPDACGLAVTLAYRVYLNFTMQKPKIDIERFSLLVKEGFPVGWKGILKGESTKFYSDNIKLLFCKKCRIHHLAEEQKINYVCPSCFNH